MTQTNNSDQEAAVREATCKPRHGRGAGCSGVESGPGVGAQRKAPGWLG